MGTELAVNANNIPANYYSDMNLSNRGVVSPRVVDQKQRTDELLLCEYSVTINSINK
jgi:hypothetical protein